MEGVSGAYGEDIYGTTGPRSPGVTKTWSGQKHREGCRERLMDGCAISGSVSIVHSQSEESSENDIEDFQDLSQWTRQHGAQELQTPGFRHVRHRSWHRGCSVPYDLACRLRVEHLDRWADSPQSSLKKHCSIADPTHHLIT